jgi:hypothetical protein
MLLLTVATSQSIQSNFNFKYVVKGINPLSLTLFRDQKSAT